MLLQLTNSATLDRMETMQRVGVIRLSNGGCAIVDPERVAELSMRKWYRHNKGYAASKTRSGNKQTTLLMHRVLLGVQKGESIDHANCDKLDNRMSNLRLATKSQNAANSGKPIKRKLAIHVSRFRGVHWAADKSGSGAWCSRIRVNGRDFYLGRFASDTDAAKAYNAAALKHFGEFARINAIP
jgi:hypothetical protein